MPNIGTRSKFVRFVRLKTPRSAFCSKNRLRAHELTFGDLSEEHWKVFLVVNNTDNRPRCVIAWISTTDIGDIRLSNGTPTIALRSTNHTRNIFSKVRQTCWLLILVWCFYTISQQRQRKAYNENTVECRLSVLLKVNISSIIRIGTTYSLITMCYCLIIIFRLLLSHSLNSNRLHFNIDTQIKYAQVI